MLKTLCTGVGTATRAVGQTINRLGVALEANAYIERLVPNTREVEIQSAKPQLDEDVFVAPSASIIGKVTVGPGSSIWYGAILRGDVNHITVGNRTSVGDLAVVHVAKLGGAYPTTIGNNVIIGPRATIHACAIEDDCVIGAGATLLDNARVCRGAVVAPGAVVPAGAQIPSGQVWAGTPAKHVRDVTMEESAAISTLAQDTRLLSEAHARNIFKDYITNREDEQGIAGDAYQKGLRSKGHWLKQKPFADPSRPIKRQDPNAPPQTTFQLRPK